MVASEAGDNKEQPMQADAGILASDAGNQISLTKVNK